MEPLTHEGWVECPAGELDRLIGRLHVPAGKEPPSKLVNTVAGVFASSVLATVLVLVGIVVARLLGYPPQEPSYGPWGSQPAHGQHEKIQDDGPDANQNRGVPPQQEQRPNP